ncbi:hypothetical protein ACEW2F_003452 [Escherichia coli]
MAVLILLLVKLPLHGGGSMMSPYPTGYTAWIVQTETSDWWLGVCHPVGEKYPAVEITWNNLSFALSIERRNAVPRHYDIQIPFYYGFEEYKLLEGVGGYVAKMLPILFTF